MEEIDNHPRCGKKPIVRGSIPSRPRAGFRPEEPQLLTLSLQFPEVAMPSKPSACACRGLLWTELDFQALRRKLHDQGNESSAGGWG